MYEDIIVKLDIKDCGLTELELYQIANKIKKVIEEEHLPVKVIKVTNLGEYDE